MRYLAAGFTIGVAVVIKNFIHGVILGRRMMTLTEQDARENVRPLSSVVRKIT